MRLGEIAARLDCALEGPPDLEVEGVAGLEEASGRELAFLANPRYYQKAQATNAGAVIVDKTTRLPGKTLLRSTNPYLAFARAVEFFADLPRPRASVHPTAVIAPSARIGRNPSIGPYVVVEDEVVIGDDCVLKSFAVIYRGARIGKRFTAHSHAVVRENVQVGDDVILQNGAVLGSDGFGFARQADGSYYKIAAAGGLVVEDGVEVQANSCIDRATVGETRLRRGVKVDNLVQIGHGCDIGEHTLLCGQVGLAGSSRLGREVVFAGQSASAGHLSVGDRVIVTAQSGVGGDVESGKIVSGSPAIDNTRWLRCTAIYAKLPEIYSAFRKIRDRVGLASSETAQ
ncbi:MAG TPA: UDP-3-O-(3-hydroxymyristoyl)glucosamine N-acyltransferase [Terriglobia bacterium]|nr:UDP-3-O-(3-hydroxymyristoyl)glucosamine N-acyltransferase [Terriglobia bacterium]